MKLKKTAFILKGYPRLSETFIAQEIFLLEQRGHDIEIISMRQPREQERQPVHARIRAPITYLPEDVPPHLVAFSLALISNALTRPFLFLKTLSLALRHAWDDSSYSVLKRFLQANWLVAHKGLGRKGNEVAHLHSHFLHAPTELAHQLSSLTGLPFSISAHAKDIYTNPVSQLRRRVNASLLLMTCTEHNYHFLRNIHAIDSTKVHRVYHGIDTTTFIPAAHLQFSKDTPRFITIGRLVAKKGYPYILEALAQLKRAGLNFTYEIFGTGEDKAELLELTMRLDLEDEVTFHGQANQTRLITAMRSAAIYLNGSVEADNGDRDGIPNTLAEAMAMELPVIATDVSGIPELIQNRRNGLLIPQRNVEALKTAILELVRNPNWARELGQAGRRRIGEFFDSHSCIQECDRLLRPLVATPRTPEMTLGLHEVRS